MAVFALTRSGRIGVDVERMDRNITDRDEIAAGFFSPMEAAVYRALPGEDRVEGFFNCWTRKESFIKAIGDGLTCPLDSFQVTLRPGDQAQLLSVRNGRAEDWSMVSLEPLNGYKSAITAEATWQLADLGEFNDAATCQRG
jgi:4'-phosphopantetheinyl transferase